MSRFYNWLAGPSEWPLTLIGLELLNAQPGEYVLEIGYGTGRALLHLLSAVGSDGQVAGIDISTGMRDVAQKHLAGNNKHKNIDLRCGDALTLLWNSKEFNAVFISFTLELFDSPEIPLLLKSCWRVLRPNGRIVIVALAKKDHQGFAERIYGWAHNVLPNYVDCRPIYAKNSIIQAGFVVEEILHKSIWGLPVDIITAIKPS